MFWLSLAKTYLTIYKEKFADKFFFSVNSFSADNNLFKRASDLMIDVSTEMFSKLDENQKDIVDWITHKKGYIGFESYLFGEYVKDFLGKYFKDFIEPWQLEDGLYLKEYFNRYPEEYKKWIDVTKSLYNKIKKIENKELENFIKNHKYLNKIFNDNVKEREKNFNEFKSILWEKMFNYIKVFCIY